MKKLFLLCVYLSVFFSLQAQLNQTNSIIQVSNFYQELFDKNLKNFENFDSTDYKKFVENAISFSVCYNKKEDTYEINLCPKDNTIYIVEVISKNYPLKRELHFNKSGQKIREITYIYSNPVGAIKIYNPKTKSTHQIEQENNINFKMENLIHKAKEELQIDLLNKVKYNVVKTNKAYIIMDKIDYKPLFSFDLNKGEITKL